MKKDKYISIINWLLLFSIPAILVTADVQINTVSSTINTKNLKTSLFETIVETKENITVNNQEIEDISIDIDKENEKTTQTNIKKEQIEEANIEENKTIEEKEIVEEKKPESVKQEDKTDVLETFSGDLSYYRANCNGCSGFTATGYDVRDGKLYYNDPAYGNVRIIASGTEIPKYSIVRIKNSSLGNEILAIVLDRGGNIGQGKKFIVDVLTNSTEAKGGVDYGVSIEVIRKGK